MTYPNGLASDGKRLWRAVIGGYELEEHERLLLEQACRTADVVAALTDAVADGLVADGKIRAEVVEARQQRIVLARLLAALRVPLGAEHGASETHGPPRLQRRAVRGVYAVKGGAA